MIDELEEVFYENSDVDVVFSFATLSPLTIVIPGEQAISAETILAGVENGDIYLPQVHSDDDAEEHLCSRFGSDDI